MIVRFSLRLAALCAGLALPALVPAWAPAFAQVRGAPDTVAVVSPPVSSVSVNQNGCTPVNPCAVVTPALGSAPLPQPETPPQPNLPGTSSAPAATMPARAAAAPADCPPVGARGG